MTFIGTTMKNALKKSTNMPTIGSLIREVDVTFVRNLVKQTHFCSVKPMPTFSKC